MPRLRAARLRYLWKPSSALPPANLKKNQIGFCVNEPDPLLFILNPLREIAPTMTEMLLMPERWLKEEASFVPSIDLQETDNAYVVNAEMSGIDPNNPNISVKN